MSSKNEEKDMTFWGHIGELRGTLIRSIIAIAIGALLIGFNINWVMDTILLGPTKQGFFTFRVINHFSRMVIGHDTITLPAKFPFQVRRVFDQFNIMMATSIVGGLLVAFPFVTWQFWKFISPGLKQSERKNSAFIINTTWFMFILGALGGYYMVMPFVVNFGYNYSISDQVVVDIDLSNYITIFLQIVLGMAVIFLFPIVVYMLTSIGLLTPQFMKKYRRHAIVLIMVVAAIITPADILSMLAAAFPLLLLYEISVLMCSRVYKRNLKKAANNQSQSANLQKIEAK